MSLRSELGQLLKLEARKRDSEAVADTVMAFPCLKGGPEPEGSWDVRWKDTSGRWQQRIIGPDQYHEYSQIDFTPRNYTGELEDYLEAYLRQRDLPDGQRDPEMDAICRSWGWPDVATMEASQAQEKRWKGGPTGVFVENGNRFEHVDNPRDRGNGHTVTSDDDDYEDDGVDVLDLITEAMGRVTDEAQED